MASLDLYTPIRAMPDGLSKEGEGGPPLEDHRMTHLEVMSSPPEIHRITHLQARSSSSPRETTILCVDLYPPPPLERPQYFAWISIKNDRPILFFTPKPASSQASKQHPRIAVSHFLFLISFNLSSSR